ncbi:MAG: sugar transferase [Planctomycetes bacterium]|nr:sugar transferase [Planctomycetota bacterium]
MSSVVPLDQLAVPINEDHRSWQQVEQDMPATPAYFAWTGWLNRIAAVLLLIPALPAIGILILLTKLTSPGPGIYRQHRVGHRGKTFTLYKIRTMRQDAEAGTGPVWSSGKGDPRVTRLGTIMRALHLDELPQLFNVLSGSMNLIGPRPERPEFTQYLARAIPGYLDRLAIKPGITGLAQIQLPPDTDLDSVRLKLATDLQYLDGVNLWMDLRILACTALRLFGIKGKLAVRAFGFNYGPAGIDPQHRRTLAKAATVNGSKNPTATSKMLEPHVVAESNDSAAVPTLAAPSLPRRAVQTTDV